MSMQLLSIGQIAACIAFLLLAWALFIVAERRRSRDAQVAAIAFAYCGVATFLQFATILSNVFFGASGLGALADSQLFQLVLNGPRPWILLLAGICVLRLARSIPATDTIPT